MLAHTNEIIKIATRLLKDGSVDMVVGFQNGTIPMMSIPCFIVKPEDASLLIWDSHCRLNLANYITNVKGKTAIIAKGCDSRNIVTHIIENKIDRDKLYIIGVPCKGMIDRKKIETLVNGEIKKVSETDESVIVESLDNNTNIFKKIEVLQANCSICLHRNPTIFDEMVGEPLTEQKNINRYAEVNRIEEMEYKDREQYLDDILSSCIRCYACKNACPLCYCPLCFVDESKPQWVGKGQDLLDIKTFHFLRAYHCAGRCTDCGACEQVCPVGINMRILNLKLEKDCKEHFNWEAGLCVEDRPALDVYKTEDYDKFVK